MKQTHTLLLACLFCLILVSVYFVNQAKCEHIVGFAAFNHVSHHRVLWKLGRELQTRGHKYTHILPSFAKETYDDVDTKTFDSSLTNKEFEDWFVNMARVGSYNKDVFALFEVMTKLLPKHKQMYRRYCEDFLKHESLIAELKESVDLVLCDALNECCVILADMLNVTRIDVSAAGFTSATGVYVFAYLQAAIYVTLQGSILLPSAKKFSFINRLKGFLTCIVFWYSFNPALGDLWEKHAKATSKFGDAARARRTHGIVLIPHDFALDHPRPLGANIKVIGAILPEPARKLPESWDKYMSENKVVVIVSFGTIFANYPAGLAQSIADELSLVSAAVLWKYSGTLPEKFGKNLKIIPWIPKNECSFNDILGHSSTKVFVTHGGMNSFQESVYHGVPMVVVPMAADQYLQGDLVRSQKLGVVVEWKSIKSNGQVLQTAINEVLNNKVYKENTERLSAIMRDRKRTPSQEGADWIEYALRHDGAPHLISEANDLAEYKLHMFDVFLFLVVIVCLVIYLLLRLCCCCFRGCRRKTKVKEKQT